MAGIWSQEIPTGVMKRQSRASLNRCITYFADEAAQMRRERDEARRECDQLQELLSPALERLHELTKRDKRQQAALRRFMGLERDDEADS